MAQNNAAGNPVLDPTTGDDAVTENRVRATASWDPPDPRDPSSPVTLNGACPSCPPINRLEDQSIAVQKSVNPVGGVPIRSGVTLEYTLEFQVSDYFTFDDIIITDTISDGQRFDTTFTPVISVTDRIESRSGNMTWAVSTATCAAAGANNVLINESQIGGSGPNPPDDGTDGSTTITFCVSKALRDLGAADGIVQGGRAVTPDAGAAVGTVTFRTIV